MSLFIVCLYSLCVFIHCVSLFILCLCSFCVFIHSVFGVDKWARFGAHQNVRVH